MSSRPPVSSRRKIYRDYLGFLSPQRARRVLWMLGCGLLAAEGAARIFEPRYERTAGNSLHGVRAIYQQALDDPAPKILAFGDSSLVGGGIYAHQKTVIGRMESDLKNPHVYNLALPGGDTTSTTVLLGAIGKRPIPNVDRVIIEVLPSKFLVATPGGATKKMGAQNAWEELERFIPAADAAAYDLPLPPRLLSERVETEAQWQLGRYSHFYRHRDFLRTEAVGNYPMFWFISKVLPRSVMARLYPAKAKGTNRLAARINEYNFVPDTKSPPVGAKYYFSPRVQGDYLNKSIELAKAISAQPPLILAQPWHYEYNPITPAARAASMEAAAQFENYVRAVAREQKCELVLVPSRSFQDPADWTATPAHFNARGARKVWAAMRPQVCALYDCRN